MRKVEWIDDAATLEAFCDRELNTPIVAVDTESDHFFAYRPFTCLVQVASPDACALIDVVALDGNDLAPLFEVFADPSREKILHSAANDFVELHRDFGVTFQNLFDTQLAAEFLRYEGTSLSWLLGEAFDIKLTKKYQRYDWRRRPIEQAAQKYAAEDVIHLFGLRDLCWSELQVDGWDRAFEEHCDFLCDTVRYRENTFDPEGWRRIKTKAKLDGPARAALSLLFVWRHEVCDEIDRAPLHVLDNQTLIRLAETRPTSRKKLEDVKIPQGTLRHNADDILDAIARSFDIEPPPKRRPSEARGKRDYGFEERFAKLKEWRNQATAEYGIPAGLIANNALLTVLASRLPDDEAVFEETPDMLNWRIELFRDEMLAALK